MFDLNRPLHAYDADKIEGEIIVRNSRPNETFKALDDKEYKLEKEGEKQCGSSSRASGTLR